MNAAVANATVQLDRLSFAYRNGQHEEPAPPLFSGFDFSVNGCTAIMGGSGSGKSTLAKLLAHDLAAQQGSIRWNQECRRAHDVVYIDQNPANSVFPWLTVAQNVRWPVMALRLSEAWSAAWAALRQLKVSRAAGILLQARREALTAAQERSAVFLKLFRLEHRASAYPSEISGGELARLALARCLSWRPRFVIIDESLSQLDRATKSIVYGALNKISAEHGTTFLVITHILADAMALAQRCVVLGERPVRILGDFPVSLPFPRDEASPEYRAAQEPLLEVLRHGML